VNSVCIDSIMCNVTLIFIILKDQLFKWVEEAMLEELEDVLPKVEVHETEIEKMKYEIEELMEIALNNKIEIQKSKVVMKCLVVYACIVSVASGAYVLY